ncbi:MAG: thrombospondin type 3 repeat-containing protein [Myxococcales bacterium]|nr:thrombospondin type 3 repeat-containing protein [Myxococcales bacterium]MCB9546698.1 thrombospondin type 3 repeat-containing protein [Myxococcales bacterium]
MKKQLISGVVGLGLMTVAGGAMAVECITTSPPGAIPAAGLVVLAQDATATSTFCGGSAGYTSDTHLVDPNFVYVGTGNVTAAGTEFDLGMFVAGQELVFSITVRDTGYTFFTGPGDRNPDGIVHAAITDLGNGVFHVGFEDLYNGGDLDYDDVNLVIETTGIVIADEDTDDDGIPDDEDNCVVTPNPDQADADGDGEGDVCDVCPNDAGNEDADNDGICGADDNCPAVSNSNQADADEDGLGDACDACPNDATNDADGDGVCEDVDNCPGAANADQANADGDEAGDICDLCPNDAGDDADGDGVCGDVDACEGTELTESVPTEELGVNRFALIDGDGVFDTVSPRGRGPRRSYTIQDTHGCSCSQIIEALDLGEGHTKFGCSISAMDDWIATF